MEFSLLGPVEARRNGKPIGLSGTKMRTLLAALLIARGRVVPDARLSWLLWGAYPPTTMNAQIYTYVSRLRKLLEPEVAIVRRAPGYAIETGDSLIDVVEFERLERESRAALQAHRYEEAGALLNRALDLWRGPALANTTDLLVEQQESHWEEVRAAALENRVEAGLALGHHQHLTAELVRLVCDFPLRERMRAQLMTALFRSGRQADALRVFHEGRRVLADELGVDPGAELTGTYQAVLNGSLDTAPAESLTRAPREPAPTGPVAPSTLPADTATFVGRGRELASLQALLAPGSPVRRGLITGMGGVGKTALALRAAHTSRYHFPDGQLYVDLADEDGTARDPREVLVRLLRALGEETAAGDGAYGEGMSPAVAFRPGLDELVRRYRARTAGRKLLVVLDNVSDTEQLAALLPGGEEPAVLVIGHAHLAAAIGPHTTVVEPLGDDDSLALLAAAVGVGRVAEDLAAAREIIAYCGGVPLALRTAGARLAARPHWSPALLAGLLAAPANRLRELRFGGLDMARSLRSWLRLTGVAEDDLRLCSALGERSFSAATAAAVLELPVVLAEDLLERLADASLMDPAEPSGGTNGVPQYRFHRLVLCYARSLPVRIPVDTALPVAS
ncbi:AfsR/SARP family transcriptional regulator [Streptomyces sp. LS1784]|uniref:AfsR/SARP family transcriptional regulator n=1 Tax=Streptomyces sp. LS1784 TaxID=2851533 RepID=UPI001CCA471E|nr:AfsR/SARP family transcriptional regulator [Streptomyces sp. LS1784]